MIKTFSNQSLQFPLIQDYGISTLTRNSSPVDMKGVVSKQSLQFHLIQDYGISTLTRNSSPVDMKGVVSKRGPKIMWVHFQASVLLNRQHKKI
jgi:hypothetical protein